MTQHPPIVIFFVTIFIFTMIYLFYRSLRLLDRQLGCRGWWSFRSQAMDGLSWRYIHFFSKQNNHYLIGGLPSWLLTSQSTLQVRPVIVSTNNLVTTTNSATWTPTYITVGVLASHFCKSIHYGVTRWQKKSPQWDKMETYSLRWVRHRRPRSQSQSLFPLDRSHLRSLLPR